MSRPLRLPASERRLQIVEAALRIIGEQGVTSFSTSTLAREVGVSSGALFRHFKTLDEILEALAEYAVARLEETFPDKSLDPPTRVFQLAANRVRLLQGNRGLSWVLRSEQALLTLPEKAVRRLQNMVRMSKAYLLEALKEGARDGSFRKDIAPEVQLVLVMGTIHALAGMGGVHRDPARRKSPDPAIVLSALRQLLAPASEHPFPETNRSA